MNDLCEEEREIISRACQDIACCYARLYGEDLERFTVTYTELQNPTNPTIRRMVRRLDLIRSLCDQLDREMDAFIDDGHSLLER